MDGTLVRVTLKEHTVDGRNPAPVIYPTIYRVLYIPGGAGFFPSTAGLYPAPSSRVFCFIAEVEGKQ